MRKWLWRRAFIRMLASCWANHKTKAMINNFDQAWEAFRASRNVERFREWLGFIESHPLDELQLKSSVIFGTDYRELIVCLESLYLGKDMSLYDFAALSLKNNSQKSALGLFLACKYSAVECCYEDLTSETVNSYSKCAGLSSDDLLLLFELLGKSDAEKISWLRKSAGDSDSIVRVRGSFFFDAVITRAESFGRSRFYLIGVQSPVDAIYLPLAGAIIKSKRCRFEVASRVRKFTRWVPSGIQVFLEAWKTESREIVWFVKDRRPYHVAAEELTAYFCVSTLLKFPLRLAFHERSSFFEVDPSWTVVRHGELQDFGVGRTLVCSLERLLPSLDLGDSYRSWLLAKSSALYDLPTKGEKAWIWIGLSGVEKRIWLEEKEGIKSFIELVTAKFGDCFFVFDGWTSTVHGGAGDAEQILKHQNIFNEMAPFLNLADNQYVTIFGSQILKKIAYARVCDYFISPAGTPALWPSGFCKVPGVVHNSTQMINFVDYTLDLPSVTKLPVSYITDIGAGPKDRWDYINYSVALPEFYRFCKGCLDEYEQ